MNAYYPVLLRLEGKRCVVIGGGFGTEDRVRGLLEAGAAVTLVAPAVSSEMEHLAADGRIEWRAREYTCGDLEHAFLAVACPPDRGRNAEIWSEAEALGIPINAIDDPPHCTFIYPAIHRQRDLVIAVSSSGKSPAVAARIRDRIGREYGPEYADLLDIMASFRTEMTQKFPSFERRREIWYLLADSGALERIRNGDRAGAEAELRRILGEHA